MKTLQTIPIMLDVKGKVYHQEMLTEIQQEHADKSNEFTLLANEMDKLFLLEAYVASTKYDIQTLISLLDEDVPTFNHESQILYEKTLISDWK